MRVEPQPLPSDKDLAPAYHAAARSPAADVQKWQACRRVALRRLPLPFWALLTAVGVLTIVEQTVEYSLRGAGLEGLNARRVVMLLAVPAMFVYLIVALRALRSGTVEMLSRLRRVVRISDAALDVYIERIVCIPRVVEWLLLAASALFVGLLLVVLRTPTPMGGGVVRLPSDPLPAALILGTYTLLGWYLLLLLYTSTRLGSQLSLLARESIQINVFDPLDRLPFGQLSLLHSLTLAGLILVLVIPLGRPTEVIDYVVLALLSLGSLFALILPLRGVRQQVVRAKEQVLERLYFEFAQLQDALMASDDPDAETLKQWADRAQVLEELRMRVLRAPAWPFRNATATVRAGLAALSPILYFLITELLRTLLTPLLAG
jgi:hypothetical protein